MPIEQQSRHGAQGAWTDVYALCATIYRCITGHSIPEVNNRLVGEAIIRPSEMGISISTQVEAALMHGLAVKPEERTQSMTQLMNEIYGATSVQVRNEYKTPIVKNAPVERKNEAHVAAVPSIQNTVNNREVKKEHVQLEAEETAEVHEAVGISILVLLMYWVSAFFMISNIALFEGIPTVPLVLIALVVGAMIAMLATFINNKLFEQKSF